MPTPPGPVWPAQTEPASSKRKRLEGEGQGQGEELDEGKRRRRKRQVIADQSVVDSAKARCENASGNEVLSCFPTADVSIPQHQWATFVWNSRTPGFTQSNKVDIYLFHGDSLAQIFVMRDITNPRGRAGAVTAQVNDTWWGDRGGNWAGTNISYPFYWVIARAGESLDDGTIPPQTTFSAVQTTFADSIISSRASASRSASLASQQQQQTMTSAPSGSPSVTPAGGLQHSGSTSQFPRYTIVIIVVGIVAVGLIVAGMLFAIYRLRRKERERGLARMRSPLPGPDPEEKPVVAPLPVPIAAPAPGVLARQMSDPEPPVVLRSGPQRTTSPDSTHTASVSGSGHHAKPFSSADAAIMAQAFRAGLRSPPHEEGHVLGEDDEDGVGVGEVRSRSSRSSARGWRGSMSVSASSEAGRY
ncbi:NAD(P)-binding protein [Mycena indigotica]|uniref:NAD(P)-binding protein n=1 Tax=Mycena indigotica TaxID=2126181 RepID=A0A8H6S4G7_9AGAR|nr:NAD(P)-binding protein [Mycena indigotica]KAF7292050.1 NAD(P)-binding protein [Mycena indigotica]